MLAIIGYSLKFLVRKTRIDRKFKILRFQNYWHYILSGEILDFPRIDGEPSLIEFTWVDIIVNSGSRTILYSGFLEEYNLTNTGNGLENIIISNFSRKVIYSDKKSYSRFYKISGDFLIIPASKIENIDITYYEIDDII